MTLGAGDIKFEVQFGGGRNGLRAGFSTDTMGIDVEKT
jgi:hypothetical protein